MYIIWNTSITNVLSNSCPKNYCSHTVLFFFFCFLTQFLIFISVPSSSEILHLGSMSMLIEEYRKREWKGEIKRDLHDISCINFEAKTLKFLCMCIIDESEHSTIFDMVVPKQILFYRIFV